MISSTKRMQQERIVMVATTAIMMMMMTITISGISSSSIGGMVQVTATTSPSLMLQPIIIHNNSPIHHHHSSNRIGSSSSLSRQLRTATTTLTLQLRGGALGRGRPAPAAVIAKKSPSTTTATVVGGGTATITNLILNLIKAIVGVGVLSLPAGVVQCGNARSALIPALCMIAMIGILSAYGFYIIGQVCSYTAATSYRDAWSQSIGSSTSWIPAVSTTGKTFLACLAFSMVLADTFSGLLGRTSQRTAVLVTLTTTLLLPLCWMKNLNSLTPFSLLGILGMLYTALAMTIRYFDGSYTNIDGALRTSLPLHLQPAFGTLGWNQVFTNPNSLILLCMLSTAYMAHFNAPKFYMELQNRSLDRFRTVVAAGFGTSIVLMSFIAAIGFLTFGKSVSGLVLNNYAAQDWLMSISRIAVAVSLVFSYPLAFQGCRDGVLDLLQVPSKLRLQPSTLNITTVVLLAILTTLAAVLKDVSFVLAFGGATLGNLLTYVYPAMMYTAIVKRQNRKDQRIGVIVANLSAVLGIIMGIIGAKMALEK